MDVQRRVSMLKIIDVIVAVASNVSVTMNFTSITLGLE